MKPVLDFSTAERAMNAVIGEMSKLTGFDRRAVILEEVGIILKTCAARTRVADPKKSDLRVRMSAARNLGLTAGDITVNVGLRGKEGRVWSRLGGPRSRGKYRMERGPGWIIGPPVPYHWRATDWRRIEGRAMDYQTMVARMVPLARGSAGLARQSWIQIADKLGIRLESVPGTSLSTTAIAAARNATSSTGRAYINGISRQEVDAGRFFVTLINNLPFGRKLHFDSTLESVILGRVKYFATNLTKGVFASMKTIAERYKGFSAT